MNAERVCMCAGVAISDRPETPSMSQPLFETRQKQFTKILKPVGSPLDVNGQHDDGMPFIGVCRKCVCPNLSSAPMCDKSVCIITCRRMHTCGYSMCVCVCAGPRAVDDSAVSTRGRQTTTSDVHTHRSKSFNHSERRHIVPHTHAHSNIFTDFQYPL